MFIGRYRTVIITLIVCLAAPLAYADKEWRQQKSQNFIIYYRDAVPIDFVNTVLDEAEIDFRRISENLGISRYQSWAWDKRASIYIYKDDKDYVENGAQASWSHGAALVSSKTIRTYPSAAGFFDSIMPHELGHIILHEYVGPNANVPLWFDEGVAMFQEKARQLGAHKAVKESIEKGQFIPLTNLYHMRLYSNSGKDAVQLFYYESASIVNFMITQMGESRFYRLCHELKDGRPFTDSFVSIYSTSFDNLSKKWVNFVEEQ